MQRIVRSAFSVFVLCSVVVGCQKTIAPTLPGGSSQLVIEGAVSDSAGPYYVNISKTSDFYTDNVFPTVSGATVRIDDVTAGLSDLLTEILPGRYMTHTIVGTPGNTYSLSVVLDGVTYTAQSTMPSPVILDSVTIDYSDGKNITPIVNFQDPAAVANYYKLNTSRNGVSTNRLQTEFDQLTNGRYIRTHVDQDTGAIKHGDLVTVYLVGIDHPVYDFLSQAQHIAYNNADLASPATPTSNITGGCIGYFSAQTVSARSALVQ